MSTNFLRGRTTDYFLMNFGFGERIVTIDDLFNSIDTNKNGAIELIEFLSCIAKMGECIGVEDTFKQLSSLGAATEKIT